MSIQPINTAWLHLVKPTPSVEQWDCCFDKWPDSKDTFVKQTPKLESDKQKTPAIEAPRFLRSPK